MQKYFAAWYRFRGEDRYLIWITNESDSVVVNSDGYIPSFASLAVLGEYAALNHYQLENEEPDLHDLDWVASWTASPRRRVDCEKALAAWNLFGDVANSIGERGSAYKRLDAPLNPIYQKLFWGNNLPSMTPKGKHFTPKWSAGEVRSMAEFLVAGLRMFESSARPWPQLE
jgi:hypothetical protein